jgi:hypothetical protein
VSDDRAHGGIPKGSTYPDAYPEVRGVTRAAGPLRTSFFTAIARGFSESDLIAVRAASLELARELDPDARVMQWRDIAFEVRLRAREAPVVVLVEALPPGEEPPLFEGHAGAALRVAVATSVRADAPPLKVIPRSWLTRTLLALHLWQELATGDRDFDERFVIWGAAGASTAPLTPEVCQALLSLGRESPTFLECAGGAVEVRWYAAPTAATLRAAVQVVAAVRHA